MANTVSNFFTIGIALYGARSIRKQALPSRYLFGFLSLAVVGIGSFAFHATMLHTAQLSDELPMIFTTSCSMFILLDTSNGFEIIGNKKSLLLLISVVLFDILFTISYWIYRNPIYHQVVFASIMIITTARGSWLLRQSKASVRLDPGVKKTISDLYIYGALTFVLGFAIWNLDNVFCDALSRWRASIGWPAAFILEGHAWWHLLTATGAYIMCVGTNYLTLCIKDDPRKYTVVYDIGYLPRVKKVKIEK